MNIQLKVRTLENALTYFERTKDPDIERMFPRSVLTREQAIANFQASLLPDADRFGQTIWADGEYVGDIWCFCIDRSQQPNAMLSLCLFAKERWGQGIGSRAVQLFLPMVTERFRLQSMGALCLFRQSALSAPSAKEWLCCAGAICGGRQEIGLSGAVNGRRERMYQKGSIG